MGAQELRKLLEKTDNKLSIFSSAEELNKYQLSVKELFDLISDFLTDEEKVKLFDYSHFIKSKTLIKSGIIGCISDENIKLQLMNNTDIVGDFESYRIMNMVKDLSDTSKMKLLHNQEFIEKYSLDYYKLKDIISNLSNESKFAMLSDKDLVIDKLNFNNSKIAELTMVLDENFKKKILDIYDLDTYLVVDIISTFDNSSKIDSILNDTRFNKYNKLMILKSLDASTLSSFLKDNREFLTKNDIHPYEIVMKLNNEQQLSFIENLGNTNLTLNEKKEILATLKEEVKKNLDTTNFIEEYKTAISISTKEYSGQVILDLDRNVKDYCGLDNLMRLNPEELTEDQKAKFIKLCDVCPELQVISTLNNTVNYISTASEYKEAEEWITSILDRLKPEYSKAQKMAVIDNAIGKKISYSPDFDTEVFDTENCRALWKIISSGYGVCNGIARVEQYIFNRAGIESELISNEEHAFLKINDIELPLANGKIAKGNTILDPTWNLAMHRFGGVPDNFCMSYEEARKHDIDIEGTDHNCHKNDEKLQDATLNLDEQSLRQLFTSVGLADNEGKFPLKDLVNKSNLLHNVYANQPSVNINQQLLLLSKVNPEFATCQNSTMSILKEIFLNNEKLQFDKCIVNRVYNRTDKNKKTIVYIYINSNELGKRFYYANKNEGKFIELPQEEFVSQFECYETDLQKSNEIRPWEFNEQEKENIDLSRSSGKIVAQEGEER